MLSVLALAVSLGVRTVRHLPVRPDPALHLRRETSHRSENANTAMPYFTDEQRPLATEAELRTLYADALESEQARAMSAALDVLDDLPAHTRLFTPERTMRALSDHGFVYSHTAPNGAAYWRHPNPANRLDREYVIIPDPAAGFGDTPWRVGDLIWSLAQAAGVGMVQATARILKTGGDGDVGRGLCDAVR